MESSLAFARDPYGFIVRRCRRQRTDLFETRLLLRRTICLTGPEAAALFYDPALFVRHGAAPRRLQQTLFGRGGVQGLDGRAHRHRKQLLTSLVTPDRVAALAKRVEEDLAERLATWPRARNVVVYDELCGLLTRAACAWVGVPLDDREAPQRTRQITALFDGAGRVGPGYWRSRRARRATDRWIADLVEQVRDGRLPVDPDSPLHAIAFHRELEGGVLDPRTAAVEVSNLIRPTVAVAVWSTFVAHALDRYPDERHRVVSPDYAALFVQEVRRFYPFFPALVARVRQTFEWNGHVLRRGRRVLLDVHGTNQDPRTWSEPDRFLPQRFHGRDGGPFGFVPQGGGDARVQHRCPGEPVALALMEVATRFFAVLPYEVKRAGRRIDRTRLPALPGRGLPIRVGSGG